MTAPTTTQSVSAQQIGKLLKKAGFTKATTKRIDFETINVGHYEIRHLKSYGLDVITILPKNGTTCFDIQKALEEQGIKTGEKQGYVFVA